MPVIPEIPQSFVSNVSGQVVPETDQGGGETLHYFVRMRQDRNHPLFPGGVRWATHVVRGSLGQQAQSAVIVDDLMENRVGREVAILSLEERCDRWEHPRVREILVQVLVMQH